MLAREFFSFESPRKHFLVACVSQPTRRTTGCRRLPRKLRRGVLEGQSPKNLVEDLSVTDLAVWKSERRREELRGRGERFPIVSYRGIFWNFSRAYNFL